jgi:hypothetical protein
MRQAKAQNLPITTSQELLLAKNFISTMREQAHYLQPKSLRIQNNTKAGKGFCIELIMVFL